MLHICWGILATDHKNTTRRYMCNNACQWCLCSIPKFVVIFNKSTNDTDSETSTKWLKPTITDINILSETLSFTGKELYSRFFVEEIHFPFIQKYLELIKDIVVCWPHFHCHLPTLCQGYSAQFGGLGGTTWSKTWKTGVQYMRWCCIC